MSNMSYCRFRNTLKDLNDCLEALRDGDPLDEPEGVAFNKMIKVCKQIIEFSPDDPVEENKTEVLIDGAVGRYIPMKFITDFYDPHPRWVGVDPEDRDIVANGPDTEGYDEAWETVLLQARYMDKDGREWQLWLDGDLFVYTGDGSQFT